MIEATINVVGLKEALRELNTIDKKARRKVTQDFKKIAKPIVDDAKAKIPVAPPISGWGRKWTDKGRQLLPWDGTIGQSYLKARLSTKQPREYGGYVRNLAVFYVSWSGAINAIYDMAGRRNQPETPQGRQMIAGLEAKYGKSSRALWPAYEMNRQEVEKAMQQLVNDVMAQVNRNLVTG